MVFSRLFGKKTPLERLRRAVEESRWADALRLGEDLDASTQSPADIEELQALLTRAGDALARINLEEGLVCLRIGEADRGREHLELAQSQVRDAKIRRDIENALAGKVTSPPAPEATAVSSCASGHCAPSASMAAPLIEEMEDLDEASRFDLMLSSYPPDLAQRYGAASITFRQAFFAAHEGRDKEARKLFESLPDAERDDLYFFERGSLFARIGDVKAARRDLAVALERNPAHALALEALITLELSENQVDKACTLAQRGVETGTAAAFCLGRLAYMHSRAGEFEQALSCVQEAMQAGPLEADIVLLAASLFERKGELGEAERLLAALGGGDCKGGSSVHLAEFWLRHGRNLEKALDAFNNAARQEPDNPRWLLRIGETYVARGWKKDGLALMNKALNHPQLMPDIREAALKKMAELS